MPGKTTTKSKGCAFLEFTHRNALQQALKLHQSQLDGRLINVELTAGGGGKGETRIQKVRDRNRELHDQRVSLLVTFVHSGAQLAAEREAGKASQRRGAYIDNSTTSTIFCNVRSGSSAVEEANLDY